MPNKTKKLRGRAASAGNALGPVRVIRNDADLPNIQPGDIVIADQTEPSMGPHLRKAGAIVTAKGGRTCHAAIYSRERGIPCVLGIEDAPALLGKFKFAVVNGGEGIVYMSEDSKALEDQS